MQLAVMVMVLLLACLPQSVLHLQEHKQRELGSYYSIQVSYPQIPYDQEFNRTVKKAVSTLTGDLKRNSLPSTEADRFRNSLQGGYQAGALKNGIVSVLLDYTQDANTAVHPWGVMAVVNYDSRKCRVLTLPDLFRPGTNYVQRLSDPAIASLMRNEYAEATAIERGAGADENNFKYFTLTDTDLVLHFPMYQVAAGAAGEQTVEIPLTELAPLLNKEVIDVSGSQ